MIYLYYGLGYYLVGFVTYITIYKLCDGPEDEVRLAMSLVLGSLWPIVIIAVLLYLPAQFYSEWYKKRYRKWKAKKQKCPFCISRLSDIL